MKAHIYAKGDPSVGIPGSNAEVTIENWEDLLEDPEIRQAQRETLIEAFSEIFGEKVSCSFEDECPDCGQVLTMSFDDHANSGECPINLGE
jgi:hypothetical protein